MKNFIVAFLLFTFITVMAVATFAEEKTSQDKDILLQQPGDSIEMPLIKALKNRKSTRDFKNEEIGIDKLSAILWAGFGINRENGKHTAPMAFEKDFIKLYVYSNSGVYLYMPAENKLKWISDEKAKARIVKQSQAADAAYVILITGDPSKMPFYLKKDQKETMVHANSGCVAQNIYLMASALNLGTCMMGYFNEKGIKETITLTKNEIPLYIMPVGFVK